MKELVWSKILSVGVDEIDDDHRRLIELFNILSHAVKNGDAPIYLGAVLDELINCTVWHFSHEERLMLKHGYPDMEQHKNDHRQLIDSVRHLQDEIMHTGNFVSSEDIEYLEQWLNQHILTEDMKLGDFLINVM